MSNKLPKFTNHQELRIRKQFDHSEGDLTDQSDKNSCDINAIMLNYAKTGLLPVTQQKVARYIDNTQIMPLEEAHALIQDAKNLFMELPATIRKLMDNDPTKLETFIKNPENKDILLKYGVLEEKIAPLASPKSDSPSGDKVKENEEKSE